MNKPTVQDIFRCFYPAYLEKYSPSPEQAKVARNITKSLGSNNKQNVVLATLNALSQLKSPEEVAKLRGKSVEEIVG